MGYTLVAPQLLVLCERAYSQSQINYTEQTCREAREAARLYKLNYYTLHYRGSIYGKILASSKINLDVDMLWLNLPGFARIPKGLQIHRDTCCANCSRFCYDFSIRRLALNAIEWCTPEDNIHTISILLRNNVQELYFVVGEIPTFPNEGVIFVNPTTSGPNNLAPIIAKDIWWMWGKTRIGKKPLKRWRRSWKA